MRAPARLARAAMAVASALVITACGPAPAADTGRPPHEVAAPSERAAATVQPALVRVTGEFTGWVHNQSGSYANNGQPFTYTTTCTGFGVHPDGYIAAAAQCIDTAGVGGVREAFVQAAAEQLVAARPDLRLADVIEHGRSTWTVEGRTAGSPVGSEIRISGIPGAPPDGMPARVVEVRPIMEGDVALLKVETSNLPSLELATGIDIPVGTPLIAAGYPATLGELVRPDAKPSIKDGAVNGTQAVGSGSVYEISTALDGGTSGGPAVDHTGRVLGIISLRGTDAQRLDLAVPVSGITELLGRNGAGNELGPRDLLYREALDAYYTGEYTEAIDAFDRLLQQVPTHPRAGELRRSAESAREQHGDASENHVAQVVTWVSLGVAIVMVIVFGTLLLVARTRRRKPIGRAPAPHAPVPPFAYPQQRGGPHAPVPPFGYPQQHRGPHDPFAAPPHQQVGAAGGPYHPHAPTVQLRAARPVGDPPAHRTR